MKKFIFALICILGMIKPVTAHASMQYGPSLDPKTNRPVYMSQTSSPSATQVDETDLDWLDSFEEIDEDSLKGILKEQDVLSASINQTTGHLYLITENEELLSYYKVPDASYGLQTYLKISGIDMETIAFNEDGSNKNGSGNGLLITMVCISISTMLLPFLLFLYVQHKEKKKVAVAGNVSDDKSKSKVPDVKFSDVEGIEELKADISRLVDCLKNPEKYKQIGARPPKGVILYGPPGTGKTLIAKAIAGEAKVPFFSEAGSNFVEMYVGVGAKRIRELYKKARKAAPCIVFIDEIDAVAGQRGKDSNGERDQTVNALLTELDGFDASKGIITICATNRLDMLDNAFKRAGRFDLKLAVGLPDKKGREHILRIHGRDKKFMDEVDMAVVACKTHGFSGAELEALLNESALAAVGKRHPAITNEDIDDAFFKIVMQGNKKKRDEITRMNEIVAWHEAGHTLMTKLLTDDSVPSVTIIGSSSGAGGVTFRIPKEDNQLHSKKYLEDTVKIMYGGRAAEELYFGNDGEITTGASQDITQATRIIKDYLSSYGMGEKGMLDLSQFESDGKSILTEASELAKRLYAETYGLLKSHLKVLRALSTELLQKETLDETEIDGIIKAA